MLGSFGLILVGIFGLAGGGQLLVRGGTGIGRLAKLTPTVIGLTIVSAGTSMPELVVSLRAALAGSAELSMGNVVGSNIFNIAAILGLSAMVAPLRLEGRAVRFEWPVMFLSAWQLHLLSRDGTLDRLEGGFLFACLIAFLAYIVIVARRAASAAEHADYAQATAPTPLSGGARAWIVSLASVAAGMALLAVGAELLVHGAIDVATRMNVPQALIGLTVVAAGTSLPELAASLVAAYRGQDDIAVANVLGSNIFNVLGIAGLTAVVSPLPVPEALLQRDNLWMLGLSLLLFPIMRSGLRVGRREGLLLFAAFVAYMAVLARQL
ncbi:MAG: calcium/sodium antiporter [Myxococcales bacterium]|jgi:cation:H+ antiporter